MYTYSGQGGVSIHDITHRVRPLITLIILAKFSINYRRKVCSAGPALSEVIESLYTN